LLGYRPSAVHDALAAREQALSMSVSALALVRYELELRQGRITELDLVCDSLCTRIVERDRELERIRLELERARAAEASAAGALAEIESQVGAVRSQARGQATRIRLAALREAAEVSARITQLTRRPAESRERLLESVHEAIARIGADPVEVGAAWLGGGGASPAGPEARADADAKADAEGTLDAAAERLYDGRVEVEVGPLTDFSQLVGFEDAAAEITATSQISVKRFAQGRATVEMRLAEPVELLRELEERSPFEFRVRDQRAGRLVLDVDDE
jgi:hypothetical protein